MIINLLDNLSTKIILFLAISPGSNYSRKEIQEMTELNNVPLDYSLSKLINLKLINEKNRIYSINLDNELVRLILGEIKERFTDIPLKVQFEIMDFITNILKFRKIQKIILFGSYSKLIFSEKSDIDIAIIFKDKIKTQKKYENKINLIAGKISDKYKKEIQVHFFNESDLKHKEDPLIKDILKNGKILL